MKPSRKAVVALTCTLLVFIAAAFTAPRPAKVIPHRYTGIMYIDVTPYIVKVEWDSAVAYATAVAYDSTNTVIPNVSFTWSTGSNNISIPGSNTSATVGVAAGVRGLATEFLYVNAPGAATNSFGSFVCINYHGADCI